MECSWRLWPSPGMYTVTSLPLLSRRRAILRSAELGFFGVMVRPARQTPFLRGLPVSTGLLDLERCTLRGLRTSWFVVGILKSRSGARACSVRKSQPFAGLPLEEEAKYL